MALTRVEMTVVPKAAMRDWRVLMLVWTLVAMMDAMLALLTVHT